MPCKCHVNAIYPFVECWDSQRAPWCASEGAAWNLQIQVADHQPKLPLPKHIRAATPCNPNFELLDVYTSGHLMPSRAILCHYHWQHPLHRIPWFAARFPTCSLPNRWHEIFTKFHSRAAIFNSCSQHTPWELANAFKIFQEVIQWYLIQIM